MVETKTGEMRVCPKDGCPLIFTMEFPGAEYVCLDCGGTYGVLGPPRAAATPALIARHDELVERYEIERAERTGRPAPPPPPQDIPRPTCGGCGVVAEGRLDYDGKPSHWYSRTRDGVTSYACSRACIPADQFVLPW